MLVLTRKQEENVVIDDVITVKILKVQGQTVRLGFDAPRDVKIRRGELRVEAPAISPSQQTEVIALHAVG